MMSFGSFPGDLTSTTTMMINSSMRAPTADSNSAVARDGESPERDSSGGTSALALMHTQEIQKHTRFGVWLLSRGRDSTFSTFLWNSTTAMLTQGHVTA